MSNFAVDFSVSPWLLLLIIPAIALIVATFFIGKRRKLTTNRIIAAILQSVVFVLCIFAIAGINVTYDEYNSQNEMVILVDNSFTTCNTQNEINDFIHELLKVNNGLSQIAIVTFGYDQKVLLEMGNHDPEDAYAIYTIYAQQSPPEDSATDIAAALQFVWDPNTKSSDLIKHPETAKILLISDGLQTDQDAISVVRRLAQDGINVDTTFFSEGAVSDASIVEAKFPDKKLMVGESFSIELTLKSSYQGQVDVIFEDRNENGIVNNRIRKNLTLNVGTQTLKMTHSFDIPGHHELTFRIQTEDTVAENNVYYVYYDLSGYNQILIIEKYPGESNALVNLFRSRPDTKFLFVTTAQIDDNTSIPANVDMMAQYNEIILYNIARSDMTDEFERNLYTYVNDLGGGLFTVGGYEKDAEGNILSVDMGNQHVPQQHSYLEDDLKDSIYQSMLPVVAEPYTPPLGVVFIIDTSGSMRPNFGVGSLLDAAIDGAISCLDTFNQGDFVGVVSLEEDYTTVINMTPMTQRHLIEKAIKDIADSSEGGGTDYTSAITQAGNTLNALTDIERKHIVLLSDGLPSDLLVDYTRIMGDLYKMYGISISVVSIGNNAQSADMEELARIGGGTYKSIAKEDTKTEVPELVYKDLKFAELQGVAMLDYNPSIGQRTSLLNGITDDDLAALTLTGFFTTHAKNYGNVQTVLMAKYVPLYAQWEFGNGRVGSIMIDLERVFSRELLNSNVGADILNNILSELMMEVAIQSQTLDVTLVEDNYRTQVNIYGYDAEMEKDSKLVALVQAPSLNTEILKFDLNEISHSGNRFTFENLDAGIYTITVIKVRSSFDINSDNIRSLADIPSDVIYETVRAYRSFSYSKEYDLMQDPYDNGRDLMAALSTRELDDESMSIYDKLVYRPEDVLGTYSLVHHVVDCRTALFITAIVLYLVGIALRKFAIVHRSRTSAQANINNPKK